MATTVVMEALSPTMEEGRLVEWKVAEGSAVSEGDVLAEVETDKAVMELVARSSGTLLKQLVAAGATVPVSDPVAVIGDQGEDISDMASAAGASKTTPPAPEPPAQASDGGEAAAAPAPAEPAPATSPVVPAPGGRIKASPLARKIAADRGIDLAAVSGSGPGGRVVQRDLAEVPAQAQAAPRRELAGGGFEDVPLSQMRKTIARRLAESIGPVPTFYLTTEIDMERTFEAREALKELGPEGRVSFNDIIMKATATALRQHPNCNAWWQGDSIRQWHEVHLGMAVAIPDGLITPVIRHADQKSLRQISAEAKELADRARERRLQPEEYTGATFSVSNLGAFAIDQFTAIINPPEAGILAVGRMEPKAVAAGDGFTVRRRMRVTMSCDHRVIDGASGAEFLATLKNLLENPLALVW